MLVAAAAGGGALVKSLVAKSHKRQYLGILFSIAERISYTRIILHSERLVAVDKKERKIGIDRERDLREEGFAEDIR